MSSRDAAAAPVGELKGHYEAYHSRHSLTEEAASELNKIQDRFIARVLKPEPGWRVLDVACGKGRFLSRLEAEWGVRPFGVDLSETALVQARGAGVGVAAADAQRLPFPDSSFDAVTCLGSLEHFPDPAAGAREVSRVLKPDGKAIIYVPNLFFLGFVYLGLFHGDDPSEADQQFSEEFHARRGWEEILNANGLKPVACVPYNEIGGTRKMGPLGLALYKFVIRPLLPTNLCYSFTFLCEKK